ncbi:hypothetical protein K2Z83_19685 [Oscillochloris sp. ZM17-4]|uniref:hypothetical protein n=1 Tax=Oscillochloris sp. ZM17-4 TaxID=2866714 RepID=UPI001C7329FC|nr:hypothetical protein [Oscillochloris sp. ZM17-4]MBX0329890.1 hypothetical protein [Oscillochloris sp. ZM17-4]
MAITIRERHAAPAPLATMLSIDPALLERPEAQSARQRGLLRAKAEALKSAEGLVGWARPLLIGVLIVSFLHLWHQIARIAPEGVPALPLPAWTHWLSAALLTISVDATALYLVATRSAAQYAKLGSQGREAVWFFYLLTAALNSLFVLSYTPGLPTQVQVITPTLSLLGAILLGLLVPVSIAALERARQVADVARLSLLVEVETLRGIVVGVGDDAPAARPAVSPSTPADAPSLATSGEALSGSSIGIAGISAAVIDRACPQCGAALNAAQYGAARRWGGCPSCRGSERTNNI